MCWTAAAYSVPCLSLKTIVAEPVIALMGRANVGKSTLFNRLAHSRQSLVADKPGLTRDRLYCSTLINRTPVTLVDTAGLQTDDSPLENEMTEQAWRAALQADLVVYVCDARAGLTAVDMEGVEKMRRHNRNLLLVVNKIDGLEENEALLEFTRLGLGMPLGISATHGRNVGNLKAEILASLPATDTAGTAEETATDETEEIQNTLRITIVGRPNTGKSTLVNYLLGEQRMVVSDIPGTTHDAVSVPFSHHGRDYVLVDTAGIRRRGKVQGVVENFSVAKSLEAIRRAEIAVLLLDGSEGLVAQDLHLLEQTLAASRSTLIAVNKWDSADQSQRRRVKAQLDRRLTFAKHVRICFISALRGVGIAKFYKTLDSLQAQAVQVLPTAELTRVLEALTARHPPPLGTGKRRIRLRYAHAGATTRPVIVIHGNQVDKVPATYKKYLENGFREAFNLAGTPVRVEFRSGGNPYRGNKNKLTPRQIQSRKRLRAHIRKKTDA